MGNFTRQLIGIDCNETLRNECLRNVIATLFSGSRILDAGAGELRNKPICNHLNYVPQDICQYDGIGNNQGLHTNAWYTKKIEIDELRANGDWFDCLKQEVMLFPKAAKHYGDKLWPLAYIFSGLLLLYFFTRSKSMSADDLGCFGFHCIAKRK